MSNNPFEGVDPVAHPKPRWVAVSEKLATAEKAFFFLGERFVTVSTKKYGLVKLRLNLNGRNEVREIVENIDLVKKTNQYKTMIALGFHPVDTMSMLYVRKEKDGSTTKIRLMRSIIKEIIANGMKLKSVVVELPR